MPKYHICVLAASKDNGLAHAVEVNSGDLYSDEREQSDHRRLELSKALWHRMLRSASPYPMSRYNYGYSTDYTVVKIGEGAGTEEQTAHIANPNTLGLITPSGLQRDLFSLTESHLEDIEVSIFDDLAVGPGIGYLSPEEYGDRDKPEVVAIIYEVESTAPNYMAFAQQICSAQVKDDQLKKVLMFLPSEQVVLNRFEAVDLIEQKPKEPAQKAKVEAATPRDVAKPTTSTKPDEKAAEAAKPSAKPAAKPKSSKKKKSSSKKKTKVASPYDDKYYQGAINELLESIQSARDEYNDKKRTKHKKEFQALFRELNNIEYNDELTRKSRYEGMIRVVEIALTDAQSDFSKPFLKMGKRKTWDEYATKVTHSSSYQYPKLLSKVLHDVYSKDDPVSKGKLDVTNSAFKVMMRKAIDKINAYLTKKSTTKLKK